MGDIVAAEQNQNDIGSTALIIFFQISAEIQMELAILIFAEEFAFAAVTVFIGVLFQKVRPAPAAVGFDCGSAQCQRGTGAGVTADESKIFVAVQMHIFQQETGALRFGKQTVADHKH